MIASSQNAIGTAPITATALRSRGLAILAFALFGAWWASSALRVVPAPVISVGYVLVALNTVAMVCAATALLRSSRHVAPTTTHSGASSRRTAKIFTSVLLAELVAINVVAALLARHQASSYLTPLIAIIVGLHFFPLAKLFHTPHYNLTATSMTCAGILGVAALVTGNPASPSIAAVAAICALTLWATTLATWRISRRGLGLLPAQQR